MSNFVKLDTGMLNSSIWLERDLRSVFVTALLMAEPYHLKKDAPQIAVRSLDLTGWIIPAGWYGRVEAAGVGILMRDGIADRETGLSLLDQLCAPDAESRSGSFDGRRMARIDGGYLVLNYFEYRERDYRRVDPRGQADSYVYYAQDGDVVKIGLSKNPWARLKDLKVSRPHITIVATERGGSDLESMRHDQFKGDCIGGEWFRLNNGVQTHIDSLGSAYVETTVAPTVATVATTKKHRHKAETTTTPAVRRNTCFAFMAVIRPVWFGCYGGDILPGSAKLLEPLVREHGVEEVARRLKIYCEATEAPFASIYKFVSTFGSWGATPLGRIGQSQVRARAERLFVAFTHHGFTQNLPLEAHEKRIQELAAAGKVVDPERFKAELLAVKPWTWLGSTREADKEKSITRIASALATVAA